MTESLSIAEITTLLAELAAKVEARKAQRRTRLSRVAGGTITTEEGTFDADGQFHPSQE